MKIMHGILPLVTAVLMDCTPLLKVLLVSDVQEQPYKFGNVRALGSAALWKERMTATGNAEAQRTERPTVG